MLQLLANGIILGAVLSLAAVGLTLVYGILRFGNFAHGDTMTVGAYLAYLFIVQANFPLFVSVALAFAGTALFLVVTDRVLYRPLRKTGPIVLLIASFGVALLFRHLVLLIWGPDLVYYTEEIQVAKVLPFDVRIKPYEFWIVAAAAAAILGTHLFLKHTRVGKAMRAASDNLELAEVVGVDTDRLILWTWVLASVLAAAAGIMLGFQNGLRPGLGWELLLPLFSAAILGGIGSAYGAMAGGMVIGIVMELSTGFISTAYKPAVAFAVMIAILLIRPQGLFTGGLSAWRV